MSHEPTSSQQVVDVLRAQLQRFEVKRLECDTPPISSGCRALDRLLPNNGFPHGGFPRGSLIECLGSGPHACGAGMFAMIVARQAAAEGGVIVVLDPRQQFYPPAAAVLGVDMERMVIVRARQHHDQIWALDQALRSPAVAAVWTLFEQLDERSFRRLQLAAEEGGGLGLLVRPRRAYNQPSWSDIRLLIQPRVVDSRRVSRGRLLRIDVNRCRGGETGGTLDVEIDEATGAIRQVSSNDETATLYPLSQLAHPATRGRSARA